jgi:adenylosuccinate synthase
MLGIAAGSEIDLAILEREVEALDQAGFHVSGRLAVDPTATIIDHEHHVAEMGGEDKSHGEAGLTARIGSTGKGVGAARADRIWRQARLMRDEEKRTRAAGIWQTRVDTLVTAWARERPNGTVQVEGTQGYSLGLHTPGAYPHCTSGDCRAIDALAQVGISPWDPAFSAIEPWVVLRTFPIRVAGNSGPLPGETTFAAIGVPEEHTTVTKKVRRIGTFNLDQARAAIEANGSAVSVALTFLDYVFPALKNATSPSRIWSIAGDYLLQLEHDLGCPIRLVGTGPYHYCPFNTGDYQEATA